MYPYYPFSDRDRYRRDRRSRRRDRLDLYYQRLIIDSQISNVNQNIINTGYMTDVYQQSIVNQYRARRHRS